MKRSTLLNPVGIALYFLLRNDYSWRLLSDSDKVIIKRANAKHNGFRSDYTPHAYTAESDSTIENWENFKRNSNYGKNIKYKFLLDSLKNYQPNSVLGIGAGAGYFSNMICHSESVSTYDTIDINEYFSKYISKCIETSFLSDTLKHESFVGDASIYDFDKKYDMIVILSAVHHIPDRLVLFNNLKRHLSNKGVIVCCDPSHYIKRITILIKKMISGNLLKSSYFMNRVNLSTHHMCTLGEYEKISKKLEMSVQRVEFNRNKLTNLGLLKKYLSSQIGIEKIKDQGK